jgi:hypothetical protein
VARTAGFVRRQSPQLSRPPARSSSVRDLPVTTCSASPPDEAIKLEEEDMRGTVRFRAAAVAALLLVAPAVHAATPTSGSGATDITLSWSMAAARGRTLAVVGCDGESPDKIGRIQLRSVESGAVLWDAPPPSRPACFRNVLVAADEIYVSGDIEDDDGDGGRNLIVRRYRLADGALAWEQEFEAPNPKKSVSQLLNNADNLQIVGQKLMVLTGTTGGMTPTMLLRLSRATGALVPPAP